MMKKKKKKKRFMESLHEELCLRIFNLLDHHNLGNAIQVCRKWKALASENELWCNLFKERWGEERAEFYAPDDSKSWKDVYIVQDRCDRYGLGLKIIREGSDYYLIHQGEIQRYLGHADKHIYDCNSSPNPSPREDTEKQLLGISDRILFFLGDLEAACANAKHV